MQRVVMYRNARVRTDAFSTLSLIQALTSVLALCRPNSSPPLLCTLEFGRKDPHEHIALFCLDMHRLSSCLFSLSLQRLPALLPHEAASQCSVLSIHTLCLSTM